MKSKLWRIISSGKWQMSFCFIFLPLLHLLTPWIHQTIKQPTLSSVVSLLSAISPSCTSSLLPSHKSNPVPPSPRPVLPPPLPGEDEGRSSFGLWLQGQHSLALTTLLLVGGPVPLLALGATVACHLAATADVELSELWKDKEQDHLWLRVCLANALVLWS